MSDKKTIQVNPELFNYTSNTTRKKRQKNDNNGGIKIKTPKPKHRDDTLKKKSILKMIRQHQEEKYKKLFDEKGGKRNEVKQMVDTIDNYESEFQKTAEYFAKLSEENEQKETQLNRTLKRYPSDNSSLSLMPNIIDTIENVNLEFPKESNDNMAIKITPRTNNFLPEPKYGCLKNGKLPTYRNYTQKNYPSLINNQSNISNGIFTISNPNSNTFVGGTNTGINQNTYNVPKINNIPENRPTIVPEKTIVENKINENIKRMNEMKQVMSRLQDIKNNNIKKNLKQKKTVRRTYKVGKSKVFPRVSVLVSNRTIRNNITTKGQLLKQTSIPEIKKYLIKHGFIKVGSVAPNDVLRKMYESAILICGEVQNHNPDNLLYNFLNDKDSVN
jgi:hypothetical protein